MDLYWYTYHCKVYFQHPWGNFLYFCPAIDQLWGSVHLVVRHVKFRAEFWILLQVSVKCWCLEAMASWTTSFRCLLATEAFFSFSKVTYLMIDYRDVWLSVVNPWLLKVVHIWNTSLDDYPPVLGYTICALTWWLLPEISWIVCLWKMFFTFLLCYLWSLSWHIIPLIKTKYFQGQYLV